MNKSFRYFIAIVTILLFVIGCGRAKSTISDGDLDRLLNSFQQSRYTLNPNRTMTDERHFYFACNRLNIDPDAARQALQERRPKIYKKLFNKS